MTEDDRRVVVVGTGPAGAAAALTLWRAGIAVTVLEAGSDRARRGFTVRAPGLTLLRLRGSDLDYPHDSRQTTDSAPRWVFDLSPGGLSNHWSCAVPRFHPRDFTDGDALGEEYRWPLGYDDLREDYAEMERLLHVSGCGRDVIGLPGGEVKHRIDLPKSWRPVIDRAAALGHGLTSLPKAYGEDWTMTRAATPFNSYVRMIKTIPRSPRFDVIFGARVTKLEVCGGDAAKIRVHYTNEAGQERSMPAAAVVVAAGALASARLLLESQDRRFPEGLGNDNGLVGKYLHDHPLGKLAIELRRPLGIHPAAYLTRAPYGEVPPLSGVAGILWSGTGARLRSWLRLAPDQATEMGFSLFGTMVPDPTNRIELRKGERDKSGGTRISVKLRFDDACLREMDRARDRLMEILQSAGMAPVLKEWFVEKPGWAVHFGGTTRMHTSPRYGVVDAFCAVHGVPNVRVVDSGVFTTGPEKNPTLTAMAISARACRHLAACLRTAGR